MFTLDIGTVLKRRWGQRRLTLLTISAQTLQMSLEGQRLLLQRKEILLHFVQLKKTDFNYNEDTIQTALSEVKVQEKSPSVWS